MKWKMFLNYLGQIRIYSTLDFLVFAIAMTQNLLEVLGIFLLWPSFLLYLENKHKDELRFPIKNFVWLIPFSGAFLLLPLVPVLFFGLLSYLYAKKKQGRFFGCSAPLWRGLQGLSLALFYAKGPIILAASFGLNFLRNVIGDFRDAGDDKRRNIYTLPVVFQFHNNQSWAFYGHLLFTLLTTTYWFSLTSIPMHWLFAIFIMQVASYGLTPRLSNPTYLNFLVR